MENIDFKNLVNNITKIGENNEFFKELIGLNDSNQFTKNEKIEALKPEPIEKKLSYVFNKHLFELKKHSYVFIKMIDIFYFKHINVFFNTLKCF